MKKYNRSVGKKYEEKAKDLLETMGYEVISTNYYSGHLEIDIIAKKEKVLCFVEVKFRMENKVFPVRKAIDDKKMKHLYEAAKIYLERNGEYKSYYSRFDGILFTKNNRGEESVEHIKNIIM